MIGNRPRLLATPPYSPALRPARYALADVPAHYRGDQRVRVHVLRFASKGYAKDKIWP